MPFYRLFIAVISCLLAACGSELNDPYPASERGQNILYSAFTERPKHLDPAQSYTEDEATFTAQIYEPPLQYHYLKRPYTLIPGAAEQVPVPRYFDADGKELPNDAASEVIAKSVYEIKIKPGIFYQPHPAFAKDAHGHGVYASLSPSGLTQIDQLSDFTQTGSRELTADDYIYEIKRLADPKLHSPIFGLMSAHIAGLKELSTALESAGKKQPDQWLDLDQFALAGVKRVDRYTYEIALNGKYPQFLYWLAMPFFSPVPREVDQFYSQPGMREKNLTLDWYPVGTGPFMLTENNPNSRMVLSRNPNFHGEKYPCEGEPNDGAEGLLDDCGKSLPLIDKAIFSREKESIPYWNKFLQGYYDASGISSDSFDQAVRLNVGGDVQLSDDMQEKGIRLLTSVRASTFYLGFNFLDPVVGATKEGRFEKTRKLRQAISIAMDQEEYVSIFMNGRGVVAMSPLPPGIFGYQSGEEGLNRVVYEWKDGKAQRKSIEFARQLVAEAGWPNGRNEKTGEPLVLYLDTTSGGMGDKSRLDWLNRQFSKLNIQLVVRSTDFNRFQEKIRKGAVQLYYLGWNADYPDPENFFFLLAGSEGMVDRGGENKSNYHSADFDRLFNRMKYMDNSPERLEIVQQMNRILQEDAPWIFGFHPKSYTLGHSWLHNRKPNDVANNLLKYQRIDVGARAKLRAEWNRPVYWPVLALFATLACVVGGAFIAYRRWDRLAPRK